MFKTITIEDKEIELAANAATPFRFKQVFKKDLFSILGNEQRAETEGVEAVTQLAYIMAKQADPTIPDDPDEWLDRFEMFSIYQVLPELVTLWGLSVQTLEESKKK